MCQLMLSELSEAERAEVEKAMALLDTNLQLVTINLYESTKELIP